MWLLNALFWIIFGLACLMVGLRFLFTSRSRWHYLILGPTILLVAALAAWWFGFINAWLALGVIAGAGLWSFYTADWDGWDEDHVTRYPGGW